MISPSDLRRRIGALPRQSIALLPTPIESVPRLAAAIGLQRLLIKRDDMTGLVFGGNKVRELDFLIGDALAQGSDTFIAGGGVGHSNHARQCSAAAIKAGLKPIMVLRSGGFGAPRTGNLLLTRMLGAEIEWVEGDAGLDDRDAMAGAMDKVAARERQRGGKPYVLYSSVHPLAAVAYVECALELALQLPEGPTTIFVPSMGATYIGLRLAAAWLGLDWSLVAVTWRPQMPDLRERLAALAVKAAERLGLASPLTPKDFDIMEQGGPAYGVQSIESADALQLALRSDAVLLDPVYTAKGMAGLIAASRAGHIAQDRTVVFLHSGGVPAVFTYGDQLFPQEEAA